MATTPKSVDLLSAKEIGLSCTGLSAVQMLGAGSPTSRSIQLSATFYRSHDESRHSRWIITSVGKLEDWLRRLIWELLSQMTSPRVSTSTKWLARQTIYWDTQENLLSNERSFYSFVVSFSLVKSTSTVSVVGQFIVLVLVTTVRFYVECTVCFLVIC